MLKIITAGAVLSMSWLLIAGAPFGCGQHVTVVSGAGGGGNGSTSTGTGGVGAAGTGGGIQFDAGVDGSGGMGCADLYYPAEPVVSPADVVYVVDNSCSMAEEINAVEQNINVNFAQILQNSALDYQVIMVTAHGDGLLDLCVGPPLSGTTSCIGPPVAVPGQFHHYSLAVQSHDLWCKVLGSLVGSLADDFGQAPTGWQSWLRTEAVKTIVGITDDGVSCTWSSTSLDDQDQSNPGQVSAVDFDHLLLQAAPGQFGTPAERNYRWHSLVGLPLKPNPVEPYDPIEPVAVGTCATAVAPGTGYQWLSIGSMGLRAPVCALPSYDSFFQDLAASVVDSATNRCELWAPEEPGASYPLEAMTLLYTPGGPGPVEEIEQVVALQACGDDDDKFYIEDGIVKLCPEACDRITADDAAELDLRFPCLWI